ncbi:MAG: REP-associated tyrosine transposase [Chthoniobacterales bacterium]
MSLGKPPRLVPVFQKYDPPLFFVTLRTRNRRRVSANTSLHEAFVEYGNRGIEQGIALGRYVILPDHIHLFVAGSHDFDLGLWIRGLKRVVAAAVPGGRGGNAPPSHHLLPSGPTAAATPSLWQRGFFDHLIRNSASYEQKWNYVRENAVRAGLAKTADEWPFQGDIVGIDHP